MTDNGFNLVRSSLARKESSVTSVGQLEPSNEEIKELFAERITSETELPPMQPLMPISTKLNKMESSIKRSIARPARHGLCSATECCPFNYNY